MSTHTHSLHLHLPSWRSWPEVEGPVSRCPPHCQSWETSVSSFQSTCKKSRATRVRKTGDITNACSHQLGGQENVKLCTNIWQAVTTVQVYVCVCVCVCMCWCVWVRMCGWMCGGVLPCLTTIQSMRTYLLLSFCWMCSRRNWIVLLSLITKSLST